MDLLSVVNVNPMYIPSASGCVNFLYSYGGLYVTTRIGSGGSIPFHDKYVPPNITKHKHEQSIFTHKVTHIVRSINDCCIHDRCTCQQYGTFN